MGYVYVLCSGYGTKSDIYLEVPVHKDLTDFRNEVLAVVKKLYAQNGQGQAGLTQRAVAEELEAAGFCQMDMENSHFDYDEPQTWKYA